MCLVIAVATTSVIVGARVFKKDKTVTVRNVSCTWAYNVNDLREKVGFSDNVFVGYIDRQTETTYINEKFPQTHYSVKVIDNIKGDLEVGSFVSVVKEGGLSSDGSTLILYEDDKLPETNGYYVFAVKQDAENAFIASSPSSIASLQNNSSKDKTRFSMKKKSNDLSSEMLDSETDQTSLEEVAETLKDIQVYKDYVDAYQNEIPFDINNLGN